MRRKINLLALAVSTAALATPALAQGQQAGVLEEVLVTAQKREQSLMSVPLSLQAVSGEELELRGISDISSLVNIVPGGFELTNNGPGFNVIHFRGSGATSTTGDSTIGVYVDDTPFSIPNLQVSPPSGMFDLQRVEVLRGPQGTLYGQGSMAGTVKFITKDPALDKFSLDVLGSVSQTDDNSLAKEPDINYSLDAVVNIPVIEDKFALRISGGFEDYGGYAVVSDRPGEIANSVESTNLRIKGLYQATDDLTLKASYWTFDSEQDFANSLLQADPALIQPAFGQVPDNDTDTDIFSFTLEWALAGFNLYSASNYMESTPGFGSATLGGLGQFKWDTDAFSQDIRLSSAGEGPFNWVVGAFYLDSATDNTQEFSGFAPPLDFLNATTVLSIESESYAIYGELSYELMDGKLTPLLGFRYFEDDRSSDEVLVGLGSVNADSETFEHFSPRFNLAYQLSDRANLYVNVANGFRSGTVQSGTARLALELDGLPAATLVEPDEVWTYEVGGKFTSPDGSFSAQLAAYISEWEDLQGLYTATLGLSGVLQVGDVEIKGVEWDLSWVPGIDGLLLQWNGAYTDSTFDSIDPRLADGGLGSIGEGDDMPFTPEWTSNVNAQYSRPFGGWNLYTQLGYTYRSETDNFTGQSSDELHDLRFRVGARMKTWEAFLFVNNALDHEDPISVVSAGNFLRMAPREYGVTVRYRLGE